MILSEQEKIGKEIKEIEKDDILINNMSLNEFLNRCEGLVEYLQSEINQTELFMLDRDNDIYNGVLVGTPSQRRLNEKHIWFCKKILNTLGVNV